MLLFSPLSALFPWNQISQPAKGEEILDPVSTITDTESGNNFGWNVSGVGDVNGDGYDDIIAGAPYTDRISGEDWWNTDWSYRKKLTFDNTGQTEDLVNFPVLVNLSASNFDYLKAKLDGTDLRFIDTDNVTELNYEIEFWNSSGNSYIWVNVTRINAGSLTDYIWMYYGNFAASDGQNKSETFDSSYVGVWHLNEIGNGASDEFKDSTSYDNDGQGGSGTPGYIPIRIDGKIGGGQEFDGIDDHINSGYSTSLDINGTQITLEAWINFPGNDPLNYSGIMSHFGWDQGYRLVIENGGDPLAFHLPEDTYTLVSAQDTPTNLWVHVVGVYDGSNMMIYFNGIKDSNELSKTDNIVTTPKEFWIGHGDNATGQSWSYPWNGFIDEVRVSNIARSADWIKAQHLSMNDTLITYGDEETRNWWNNEWSYRKKLIFDNSGQSEDLINFPVLVNLSASNFDYLKTKLDGTDLRFIDGNGITELKYHIEDWNTSGSSYAWVNVTNINGGSSNDYIWMYYGNSGASDVQDVSGTYNANYMGVWHLNESSGNALDSTSYGIDGTASGGVTQGTMGQVDGAYDFEGIDGNVNMGDPADGHLDFGYESFTVGLWINISQDIGDYQNILYKGGTSVGYPGYVFYTKIDASEVDFKVHDDGTDFVDSTDVPITFNTWIYFVGVVNRSSNTIHIYKNGQEMGTGNDISLIDSIDNDIDLELSRVAYKVDGLLDEIHISNVARSADWIRAQYLSMNNSFITYGDEEVKNWWNTNWLYRKKLTFDNSGQSKDLVNFPILVNLSASNFDYLKAKLDGTDLRFIDEDGVTELKYHIEDWNTSRSSYVWVNVTRIAAGSSTDNIWMYYGNPSALDVQDASGTYNENYMGVWHMNESSGNALDSTSYTTDGTLLGGITQGVNGRIDGAYDFDGIDGTIDMGDPADEHLDFGLGSFTVSLWVWDRELNDKQMFIYKGSNSDAEAGYCLYRRLDNGLACWSIGDGIQRKQNNFDYENSTWSYIVGVVNRSSNLLQVYVNGIEQGTGVDISTTGTVNTTIPLRFSTIWAPLNSTIDEVRISNVARSADWIRAQYLSMNNGLITYGGEEALKEDCGAAYIFFGHPGLTSNNINTNNANVTIYGSNAGDLFGWSVSDAGDVNNDGYDDVIIGAPGWGADRGRAYIFHGRATGSWGSVYDADSDADVILTGENDGDRFGFSVSGAGDINSDGLSGDFYKDWLYRKKITISASQVVEDLADFPVLINITDSDLKSKARSDGYDIIFTELDGKTRLDHEIEYYNSSSGELVSWVRIPSLSSSSDTIIYMHYGNSGQTSPTANPDGVWNTNYLGVWHLDESGTGTRYDSTSNNYDGTPENYNGDEATTGRIDGADEFDGVNDCINISTMNPKIYGNFTISAWYKSSDTTLSNDEYIFNHVKEYMAPGNKGPGMILSATNDPGELKHLRLSIYNDTQDFQPYYGTSDVVNQEYHFVVGVRENGRIKLYVDGEMETNVTDQHSGELISVDGPEGPYIGNFPGEPELVDGILDEIRFSNIARSAAWITTEFTNQNDTSIFYTVGNEEIIPVNWVYRKPITINASKVTGDLTDFPTLININDSDLQSKAQVDGYDIVFTKSDGRTMLDHEIECYNSSSGELVSWIRIPSLSSSSDTIIYMYYGNDGIISPTENPAGVWGTNYMGVWHLSESSGNALDSTTYGTSGTLNGAVTQSQIGKIGNAYDFGGAGAYVDMGDPADGHLDFGNESFTYSAWINVDLDMGTWETLVWKGGNTATKSGYGLETSSGVTNFRHYISDGTTQKVSTGTSIAFDTWYYLTMVIDRSSNIMRFYCNGTEVTPAIDISGLNSVNTTENLSLSRSTFSLDGLLDEVRIINGAKTVGWITTEYNNQNDTDSFCTIGTEEIIPINWLYRKPITINSSKVTGNLTDYPMLISIVDSDLKEKAQGSGNDIVFTEKDGRTKLDHEIESYDVTNGELTAWIRIPYLSSIEDTKIYMHYGNSESINMENPQGVWDSDYMGIWHLAEGGIGTRYDSTGNGNNGTPKNYEGNEGILGKIGGADKLDGINDYIATSNGNSVKGLQQVTIETWINLNSHNGTPQKIYDEPINADGSHRFEVSISPTSTLSFGGRAPDSDSHTTWVGWPNILNNSWYHIVAVFDSITDVHHIYFNGIDYSDSVAEPAFDNTNPERVPKIGSTPNGNNPFNGTLDEIRISKGARSADWVLTEYNNQNDTSSFYTVGAEESFPQNWMFRKVITINASQVTDNLTDFPMLIDITDIGLKNKARSDGYDIIFTGDDGWTRLDHEIERYNGSSGELTSWIRIPYLSSSSDTIIYMYYGNSGQTSPTENPMGVWDENYKGVWHLHDDLLDSTSNDQDGINSGSTDASGMFANGQEFDDTNHVYVPDFSSTIVNSTLTLSGWVNASTPDGSHDGYFGIRNGDDADFYALRRSSGTELEFRFKNSTGSTSTLVPFPQAISNEWHYISFVYDGTDARAYINGIQEGGIQSSSGYIINETVDLFIGTDYNNNRLIGIIDEVRFSNTHRSPAWIVTEFNNQNDTGSFFTVGNEEIIPQNWLYRKQITINSSQVNDDLTDFPMLINVIDSDLKTKQDQMGMILCLWS
jgi:hypothetical protein